MPTILWKVGLVLSQMFFAMNVNDLYTVGNGGR
jgi:hypothetical protein